MAFNEEKLIKWSGILAACGTMTLAITALITVAVTLNAWKVQREAARPYLSLMESPKVEVQSGLSFEFKFSNVGVHPAVNLSSQTLVFNQNLTDPPIHNDQYDLVNEIPKDMPASLVIALDTQEVDVSQPNIKPYYIVVYMSYADPLIDRLYHQTLYYKWNGIEAGTVQPVVHIEMREKERISEYLKTLQINPESRSG